MSDKTDFESSAVLGIAPAWPDVSVGLNDRGGQKSADCNAEDVHSCPAMAPSFIESWSVYSPVFSSRFGKDWKVRLSCGNPHLLCLCHLSLVVVTRWLNWVVILMSKSLSTWHGEHKMYCSSHVWRVIQLLCESHTNTKGHQNFHLKHCL